MRVLSQTEVEAAGGRLLGIELSRADGGAAPAVLDVAIDYAGLTHAFGGDFASRLRLLHAATCPTDVACMRRNARARNDTTQRSLTARGVALGPDPTAEPSAGETVATSPDPASGFGPQPTPEGDDPTGPLAATSASSSTTTLVASSASSGPNGDYTASALAGSDRWDVGVGSGAFTYSYPIGVPPAVAGAAPSLSVDYNSQSVDGRTLAENGQAPKVGEGWNFEPGFIERKFKACGGTGANRADLCWSNENEYFLNFGGRSAEMVRKPGTNEWRIRGNDPGWRITNEANADNVDNDGEWFLLTTPDGTRYAFGYGTEPSNTPTLYTSSAFEVPVYGDNSGEPCHNAILKDSYCLQAYRWNLDRVRDINNNVTTFFYTKERNYYARQATSALATRYVRAGFLKRVEYSQRVGSEGDTAHTRVLVTTAARCSPTPSATCATPTRTTDPTAYPDVPLDMMCADLTTVCPTTNDSPTFWSTQAISKIATEFWHGALATPAYELVSTYDLDYSFPVTSDGTTPSLWLKSIKHVGEYGVGSAELPPVRFYGAALANRVNAPAGSGVAPLYKYRVDAINNELGAQMSVTYGRPHPCPTGTIVDWTTNPYDCFPAWYDPQDETVAPGWVAFHKYLVTKSVLSDERGGQRPRVTSYTYEDTPAWHYADSLLNKDNQSWSDYRGHSEVKVVTAGSDSSQGQVRRHVLFRGMHGDKLTATTSKTSSVQDSLSSSFVDYDYLAGMPLEVLRYDADEVHLESTLYRYWAQQTIQGPTGFQPHNTQYVRESKVIRNVRKQATSGEWRKHETTMAYSPTYGTLLETSDSGTPGVLYDNTCTKLGYAENVSAWIIDRPYRTTSYDTLCGGGGAVTAETAYWYDGNTDILISPPSKANLTETHAYSSGTASSITRRTYDALGRIASVMSPNEAAKSSGGQATTTKYAPTSGYPHAGITVTTPPPNDSVTTGQSATTLFWFAWGTPRRVTDANEKTTTFVVDPLGRTTEVRRPGDASGTPSATFEYKVDAGGHNRITTRRLLTGSTYVTTYEYLDGFGRSVQTQQSRATDGEAGSRVTLTSYDALGQVRMQSAPFALDKAPGVALQEVNPLDIMRETRFGYDALGRVYRTAQYAYDALKYATDISHTGWSRTVHGRDRASGDSPKLNKVDHHFDVYGRTTQIVSYNDSNSPIYTDYTYTPLGDLATIVDDNQKATSYEYDRLRRRTRSTDPNQGTWITGYNPDGSIKSVQDAEQQTVLHYYDRLGRKTKLATKLTGASAEQVVGSWEYDTLGAALNGVGRLTKSTTTSGSANYVVAAGGYDDQGRLRSKTFTVPAGGANATLVRNALEGSYTFHYGYNSADLPTEVTLPGVPGVAALTQPERVVTAYNASGFPTAMYQANADGTRAAEYVANTTYFNNGETRTRSLRPSGTAAYTRTYTYDAASGRVVGLTTGATGAAVLDEDVAYTYDSDQNVTSITDRATGGPAERECFRHDKLNRLVKAFTTSPSTACSSQIADSTGTGYNHTYTYNDVGDITAMSAGGTVTQYEYATANHPHAVSRVWTGAIPTEPTHTYDSNGATVRRTSALGVQTLTWSPLHQLVGVSGPNQSSFLYDVDGNRLMRESTQVTVIGNGTGETQTTTSATLFLDDVEIRAETTQEAGTTSPVRKSATRYYGGFATRTAIDGGPASFAILLRNHQNSATTQISNGTVTRERYTPYGAPRRQAQFSGSDRGFLDKSHDATGLVAMGARYYDPAIGRFMSVDPLLNLGEPQSLAGYMYARANPVTMSDPTGLEPKQAADGSWYGWGCADGECTDSVEGVEDSKNHEHAGQAETRETERRMKRVDKILRRLDEMKRRDVHNYWALASRSCDAEGIKGPACEDHYRLDVILSEMYPKGVLESLVEVAGLVAMVIPGPADDVVLGARFVDDAVNIEKASFAQRTFREMFGAAGKFAGMTIDDVTNALRSGTMAVKDVPVNVIVREGHTLILNTRSANALNRAGIPRSQWNVINRTGDKTFERMLTGQLTRNQLDARGILQAVSSG